MLKKKLIELAEDAKISDSLIRTGIRFLIFDRMISEQFKLISRGYDYIERFADQMSQGPIALMVSKPNEQHYELPPDFFSIVLGKYMKYSACFWPKHVDSLDDAEENMLALTAKRAQIQDGMEILDLGCGWGAFSLWVAAKFGNTKVTAVSNSNPQRTYIDKQAKNRGLSNLNVITADMNGFDIDGSFDRIVSIEMFEHMRNWKALLKKIAGWLKPEGKFFLHIFTHRSTPYFFETSDDDDWMGRHFFTAGVMPSDALLYKFQDDLKIEDHWRVGGVHYQKTAEAWLKNLDSRQDLAISVMKNIYGSNSALKWLQRWRMFFMACAELWGIRKGRQWLVSHYLMSRQFSLG